VSVPLALNEACQDGRIKRGDLVLPEALGDGLAQGSAPVRAQPPRRSPHFAKTPAKHLILSDFPAILLTAAIGSRNVPAC